MRHENMNHSARHAGMAGLVLAGTILSGCSAGSGELAADARRPASGVALSMPVSIAAVRQVNRSALRPQVLLDGINTVPMQRDGEERWSGAVLVEPNASYSVSIVWIETLGGRDLPLAQFLTRFDSGTQGGSINLDSVQYDSALDFDADGFTNLDERRDETDPFEFNGAPGQLPGESVEPFVPVLPAEPQTPDEPTEPVAPLPVTDIGIPDDVQVLIPRVGERGAPRIDGLGVELDERGRLTGEWSDAVQTQRDGTPLTINALMIDQEAEGPDGTPYRRWAAMHDDDWLYVVVLVDDDGRRRSDSFFHFDDDSLEFFIDGDNSKNTSWGDNDDFHFVIPMLPFDAASKTSNTSADGRFSRGLFSSRRRVDLDFATGPGVGPDGLRRPRFEQDIYEMRFGLQRAGIEPGAAFGIELQVNDDDDGRDRDAKWGWFHPSRSDQDIDFTVGNPSIMGTAILSP